MPRESNKEFFSTLRKEIEDIEKRLQYQARRINIFAQQATVELQQLEAHKRSELIHN